MSQPFTKHVLLSALAISCYGFEGAMAGDCGCDYQPACPTIQHIHRHIYRHCGHHNYIPSGMVVPSVASMPMAAMPMAATVAIPAPTFQLAPQQAPKTTCGSDGTASPLEQAIARSIAERAFSTGGPFGAAAAPNGSTTSLETKIDQIDQNLSKLAQLTQNVSEVLKAQDARLRTLEKLQGVTPPAP